MIEKTFILIFYDNLYFIALFIKIFTPWYIRKFLNEEYSKVDDFLRTKLRLKNFVNQNFDNTSYCNM